MNHACCDVIGMAYIAERAVVRILAGHPWVYKSDITQWPATKQAGIVDVYSHQRKLIGRAFFSPASTIALRLLTRGDVPINQALVLGRLQAARARRARLLPQADAYRLVHGEADFLPAIFIDVYQDVVVLQTMSAAADTWIDMLVALLIDLLQPCTIVLRNDAASRSKEQLPRYKKVVYGTLPDNICYHEGHIECRIDVLQDQKTGGFLDQLHHHIKAGHYAQGRGLDCFTYHGGFALQMARQCQHVLAYDISAKALAQATHNAKRANIDHITFEEADVFDKLPQLVATTAQFETIVLDPPAFASTQDTVAAAMRAYKEINRRAMQLLVPNGILITCSCSGRVRPEDFDAMLTAAARAAKRSLHVIERLSAGPDHPVLDGVDETDYLKCRVLMVL